MKSFLLKHAFTDGTEKNTCSFIWTEGNRITANNDYQERAAIHCLFRYFLEHWSMPALQFYTSLLITFQAYWGIFEPIIQERTFDSNTAKFQTNSKSFSTHLNTWKATCDKAFKPPLAIWQRKKEKIHFQKFFLLWCGARIVCLPCCDFFFTF